LGTIASKIGRKPSRRLRLAARLLKGSASARSINMYAERIEAFRRDSVAQHRVVEAKTI
jgi:hypothetical protein